VVEPLKSGLGLLVCNARFCSFCFSPVLPRAPSRLWPAAPSCVVFRVFCHPVVCTGRLS
jgi:hypothetical protein